LKKTERKQDQQNAEAHLRKVSDRYVYDSSSGLYKQKSANHEENRSTDTNGHSHSFPFFVDVRRDWVPIVVSALSIALLGVTIYYARKQWKAMDDTLREIKKQTISNKTSAEAAKSSADTAAATLRLHDSDRRLYVIFKEYGNVIFDSNQTIKTGEQIINIGQSLAERVTFEGHIWYGEHTPERVDAYFAGLPDAPSRPAVLYLIPHTGENDPGPESPGFRVTTFTSKGIPTAKDMEFIHTNEDSVMIAGRVWYVDTIGNQYRTDFCSRILLTGLIADCKIADCKKHNEIK
jgi:hypothetical protein